MIALAAARLSEGVESPGLLRWLVPASVGLHIALFTALPSARRAMTTAPPPLVLEVADIPPPPVPPEPVPSAAEPSPEPVPARPSPAPSVARASGPRVDREPAPASATPASEAPMDFTSTVFSNDGPGLAVGGGGSPGAPVAGAATPARSAPAPAARVAPRIVPPGSLARRPRAPGLDVELERQYPAEARRSGISGSAMLRVRILPDGRVGEVRVLSETWTGFGPACERTVRAARWEPPIDRDGTPVATEITYTCRFEVRT